MSSIKPSSRYAKTSLDSSRSSTKSDPSSSTDTSLIKIKKGSNGVGQTTHQSNFTSMVKKFVEHKSSSSSKFLKKEKKGDLKLVIPVDFIAEDLKKTAAKRGGGLSGLHKKLFKGSTFSAGGGVKKKEEGSGNKALTEVKGNTRTLGMVLRSERDLLSMNKEQEDQIVELKLMLEEKNREVEKLKDLCLKQREEIKSLKNSILFPDVMNSQVQDLLEKQGSELRQAKQLIPNLQRQVTSLTGQLQCLAEDLAEVTTSHYCLPSVSYESFGLFVAICLLSKPLYSDVSCILKNCMITYEVEALCGIMLGMSLLHHYLR
ncbi:putative RNA-dependent RNA polymerase 6-like isoform X1 [Capsicum annuum]|nr:putative RNA-dependent RNA polymerase 6-like isoform X1 [Capsicum annuum]